MQRTLKLSPILLASVVLLAALAPSHAQKPVFDGRETVFLTAGAGAAKFSIANPGNAPIPLALTSAAFSDNVSHAVLPKPRVTFKLAAGGAPIPAALAPGQTLHIEADLSDVTNTSAASVVLFNGNDDLGRLNMYALDAPLNITVDGPGTPDKPLPYTLKSPVSITLKNGDAEPYRLDWAFQLEGHQPGPYTTVNIAANGTLRLTLTPAATEYTFTDRIRPASRSGILLLSLHGPAPQTAAPPSSGTQQPATPPTPAPLPTKLLPVSLSMNLLSTTATSAWSFLYVALVLLLGGGISLLASSVLPNVLRKISMRTQLQDLADRTTGVSTRVDSYLRVLLRLERKKIDMLIKESGPLSLSSTENFDQIAASIDQLGKRLAQAERIDSLRRKFEEVSATAPPSVTEDLDKKLQSAADQLHAFTLTDAQLASAKDFLDKADATLATLNDPDALAKLISSNFRQLKTRIAVFPPMYYMGQRGIPPAQPAAPPQQAQSQQTHANQLPATTPFVPPAAPMVVGSDLQAALPGVFEILDKPFDDPKNIAPQMLFAIDHGVAAMQLALDYAMVRVSLPSDSTAECDANVKLTRSRLLAHECELINLLGTLSWGALREAGTLVQEMREGIYEQDVLDEIARPRQAEVVFDTQKARPYLPVFFTIAFKDNRYNRAAAVQRLLCHWTFPDQLFEDGWKVCHFFPGERPHGRLWKLFHPFPSKSQPDPAQPVEIKAQVNVETPATDAAATTASKASATPPSHARSSASHKAPHSVAIVVLIRSQRASSDPTQPHNPAAPPPKPERVGGVQHRLTNTLEIQPMVSTHEYSRAIAETVRFAIAFGVALAGLFSGALDQLGKLDFLPATIAILALGFGADSVKNLLTQSSKKA